MKIVQVTPRYPPHTGGVEKHVKEISERLVERGHEVTVLTADANEDINRRETINGVGVRRHRSYTPSGAFHVSPGIASAIRRLDADVIHAHNYHSLPAFFAKLGVGERKFIVTPHYHGKSASTVRDVLLSVYHPFGKSILNRADDVIAVSEWERGCLQDDFGIDATVISNGVDLERFVTAEPETYDRPYILCVGRLEEYKGVHHVICALTEFPEYDLLIVGKGPYRNDLERIARENGVTDQVAFLGYVDDDRLPKLYSGAEAYVTLSAFEAYGITVGEALAAGTPCVVRKTEALVDWLSHEGVVGVENLKPKSVKAAFELAVTHRPTSTDDPSTWRNTVENLMEIYNGVRESSTNHSVAP